MVIRIPRPLNPVLCLSGGWLEWFGKGKVPEMVVAARVRSGHVKWLALVSLLILLSGCVSKIPGGGRWYSLDLTYMDGATFDIKDARVVYGWLERARWGGWYAGFRDYHELKVDWRTSSGQWRSERVLIGPLMKAMRQRQGRSYVFPSCRRGHGLCTLVVEMDDARMRIYYNINVQRRGRVFIYENYNYDLYASEGNSNSVKPLN